MAKSKGMTDEVRQRLKAAQEAKRGRETLSGLDKTLGLVAMDHVQEQESLPTATIRTSGELMYQDQGNPACQFAITKVGLSALFTRRYSRGEKNPIYPWVHLRRAPEWISQEFANRFQCRRIAIQKYNGPSRPQTWETVIAIPLPLVLVWLRFIWPEAKEWGSRAQKYLVGYTNRYTVRYPGVGAKILITNPIDLTLRSKFNGPATVVELEQDGSIWVHRDDVGSESTHTLISRIQDTWGLVK